MWQPQVFYLRPLQVVLLFWSPARMLLAIFRLSASSLVCILHAQSSAKIFYWQKIAFLSTLIGLHWEAMMLIARPHDPPGTETEIPLVVALLNMLHWLWSCMAVTVMVKYTRHKPSSYYDHLVQAPSGKTPYTVYTSLKQPLLSVIFGPRRQIGHQLQGWLLAINRTTDRIPL